MFDLLRRSINPSSKVKQSLPVARMTDGNTFTQYAGLGNMQRLEEPSGTNLPLGIGGTPSGAKRQGNLRNTIDKLLGDQIQLNMTRAVDLDQTYQSAPMVR